ncbi:MAG TPA: hypothetical protein VHT72_00875, partial [Puia sp.]|nr:hypothetical protein [Puia sp.]
MDEEHPAERNLQDDNSLPGSGIDVSLQPEPIQHENMEVHHHPDLKHKKKHWTEYFLEFLMIFLAVTLGFLAENLREHISEKDRAEIYAQSLIADFRADTATLHQLIFYTKEKIRMIDSLDNHLHTVRSRTNDSLLYTTIVYIISTFQFDNINGTYEQIKNSGSMRFFNQAIVNNLNSYDAAAGKLKLMEDWENKFLYERLIPQTQEMINYKVIDDLRNNGQIRHEMYIRNANNQPADILINQSDVIKNLRRRQSVVQKVLLQKAEEIITELTREFHF